MGFVRREFVVATMVGPVHCVINDHVIVAVMNMVSAKMVLVYVRRDGMGDTALYVSYVDFFVE